MLSPRFIPQSVFYNQSVVRSPQSVFYTDRGEHPGDEFHEQNGGYRSNLQCLIPVRVSSYYFLSNW